MRGQRASFCRVRPQSTLDMCTRHGLRGLSSAPFLGETRQGGRRTGQSPSSRCVRPRGTDSVLTRGTERALCKESLPTPARPGSLRVSFPVDDLLAQGSSGDGTQTPGLCKSENKRAAVRLLGPRPPPAPHAVSRPGTCSPRLARRAHLVWSTRPSRHTVLCGVCTVLRDAHVQQSDHVPGHSHKRMRLSIPRQRPRRTCPAVHTVNPA